MPDDNSSRVAVVTGAGRGIGRAIAIALARSGMTVALVARSTTQLNETLQIIEAAGGSGIVVPADVTKPAQVSEAIDIVVDRYKHIDVLVNNAGAQTAIGPVGEDNPADWWNDVTVNLYGTYLFCRYAISHLRTSGTIINISSGAGIAPFPNSSAYGASKAAVLHLSETLALELAPRSISVFAVRPGVVRTALSDIIATPAGQKYLGHIAALFSPERQMEVPPERAADLVVRLCNPDAALLSGRLISVYDDFDLLLREAEHIKADNLYVLRMRTL